MQTLVAILGLILTIVGYLIVWIASVSFNWWNRFFTAQIQGLWARWEIGRFHAYVRAAPSQALEWMKKAVDDFIGPTTEWAGFVQGYFNQLIGYPIDVTAMLERGIGRGGASAMEALGETFLTPMMALIMPGAGTQAFPMGITPQDGKDAAERFLGVNLEFQMRGWLLHLLGDTMSFGMWKALKDLPNAISWSFGIGWLSWLVMGTPFRMGIAEPLEILYNQLYRPFRLSIPKLADAFWRGLISEKEFYEGMKDHGIPDPLMPVVMEQERTKPSDAQVYQLYRMGKLSHDDLVAHHRAQGHSPEDAELLATEMERRRVRELLEDVAKAAEKHYLDRRMSVEELRAFLIEAGFTDEEATLEIERLNLLRALEPPEEVRERVLTPANIGRLYQKGIRTRQWAELKLAERQFRPDEIDDFLALYEPKVPKPPEPKEPPAGLIGWLYQKGMITEEVAKRYWRELDLSEDYIALLAMRYAPPVPPPPPPPREFSPTEVGRLYREHYLTLSEALRRLRSEPILMRPEDAELYLEAFYKPIEVTEPPPREAPVSVVGNLYKTGQITREEFEEHLDLLGYSPTSKEFLIKYYTPPPEVPPPPLPPLEFRPTTIGRLYKEGGITRDEALRRLTTITPPMTMEDAILFLDTLYTPEE